MRSKKKGFSPRTQKDDRLRQLLELERHLKVKFKDRKLLDEALTHPSFAHERKSAHNERLEFLGDSFLGLSISHLLYGKNLRADEGKLTKMKSHLVSAKFLWQLSRELGLGKFLQIGHAGKNLGELSPSMGADAVEALLGALYLDQGYEKAFKFVEKLYKPHLKIVEPEGDNYKGILQEILQRKYKEHPSYELLAEHGPDHSKIFEVKVLFRGKVFGIGKGNSKKEAEKQAAKEALAILGRE